jgi:hypothetical protein
VSISLEIEGWEKEDQKQNVGRQISSQGQGKDPTVAFSTRTCCHGSAIAIHRLWQPGTVSVTLAVADFRELSLVLLSVNTVKVC